MPLQQLVEYFNDRIEREQLSSFRPFKLIDNRVFGWFGPLHVSSQLNGIHDMRKPEKMLGYSAICQVFNLEQEIFNTNELDQLLKHQPADLAQSESVIQFDRLTRTVHMLNYLPYSHEADLLFLDVDPRHILGVKSDHGAYFEEIINRCGLATHQVVITLSVHGVYSRFYQTLLKGLSNYQQRGYKIAIKLEQAGIEKLSLDFIARTGANFVGLSASGLDRIRPEIIQHKVALLQSTSRQVDAKHYVFNCDEHPINNPLFNHFDYWQNNQAVGSDYQNTRVLKRCS